MAFAAARLGSGRGPAPPDHLRSLACPVRNIHLEGVVDQDPEAGADGSAVFVLSVRTLARDRGPDTNTGGRVRVSVRREDVDLKCGDLIRVSGTLRRTAAPGNPGQTDFRVWLRARAIDAVMTCWSREDLELLGHGQGNAVKLFLAAIRREAVETVGRFVGFPENEVLAAVIFGARGRIPNDIIDDFIGTGIIHVLVASGLNVGLLAWLCLSMFGLLGTAPRKAVLLTLPVLIFYMMLCGGQPPLVRSTLMFSLLVGAKALGKKNSPVNAIGAAALIVLLAGPELLWDRSFQFSFAATFGILSLVPWITEHRGPVPKTLAQLAGCTLAAQLALLPFLASSVKSAPFIGALANLFVIPVMGLFLAAGVALVCLGWVPGIGLVLGSALKLLLHLLLELVAFMASLPLANVTVPPFSTVALVAYCAWGAGGLAWLAAARAGGLVKGAESPETDGQARGSVQDPAWPRVVCLAGALALAILVWRAALAPSPGTLAVTFLDVGQGLAVAVRLPTGRTILLDAGPPYAGPLIVTPALKTDGVGRLAGAIVSHSHTDHTGGMRSVLSQLPADFVCVTGHGFGSSASYANLMSFLRAARIPCRLARNGTALTGERQVEIRFIHPPAREFFAQGPRSKLLDENSAVLFVTFGKTSILLPSDITARAESAIASLIDADGRDLVLQVPHHGSASASSARLLMAARPRFAIVSAGASSRAPLPHPAAVIRLRDHGADIWTTSRHGAIRAVSDGTRWRVFAAMNPGPDEEP